MTHPKIAALMLLREEDETEVIATVMGALNLSTEDWWESSDDRKDHWIGKVFKANGDIRAKWLGFKRFLR